MATTTATIEKKKHVCSIPKTIRISKRVTKKPDRTPREWNPGETYDISIEELYRRIERELSRQNFISANIYREMVAMRLGDTTNKISRELALRGNTRND